MLTLYRRKYPIKLNMTSKVMIEGHISLLLCLNIKQLFDIFFLNLILSTSCMNAHTIKTQFFYLKGHWRSQKVTIMLKMFTFINMYHIFK